MPKVVNVQQAKTHLSRLLDKVRTGEVVILAKAGRPYAKMVPNDPVPPRQSGFLKMAIPPEFFAPLPEDEPRRWES